jgi:hypothetical protein
MVCVAVLGAVDRLLARAARIVPGINSSFPSRDRKGPVLGPRSAKFQLNPQNGHTPAHRLRSAVTKDRKLFPSTFP